MNPIRHLDQNWSLHMKPVLLSHLTYRRHTAGGKNKAPDADPACIGTDTARIRAERNGNGNGRVYEIIFVATDSMGAQSVGSVKVCVPHDQGKGSGCSDDGQLYDATGIN